MRVLVVDSTDKLSEVVEVDYAVQTRTMRVMSKCHVTDYYNLCDSSKVALKLHTLCDDECTYVVMPVNEADMHLQKLLQTGYDDLSAYVDQTFISPDYRDTNINTFFKRRED